jgi:hypothetical protein
MRHLNENVSSHFQLRAMVGEAYPKMTSCVKLKIGSKRLTPIITKIRTSKDKIRGLI